MKRLFNILLICVALQLSTPLRGQSLRVMSANAKECGAYDNYDYRGFASAIKSYDVDVVALQEVDDRTTRNKKQDWVALLAKELDMCYYYAKAFDYQGGSYGVAILSKYPFYEAYTARSAITGLETRASGCVTIALPGGESVRVGSLHLSVTDANNAQVKNFADFTKRIYESQEKIPTIFMGDFNSLQSSSTMNYVRINWRDLDYDGANTFPATKPTSRIDYIIGYPKEWSATSYKIVSHPELSDHCWVVADVVYNKE